MVTFCKLFLVPVTLLSLLEVALITNIYHGFTVVILTVTMVFCQKCGIFILNVNILKHVMYNVLKSITGVMNYNYSHYFYEYIAFIFILNVPFLITNTIVL